MKGLFQAEFILRMRASPSLAAAFHRARGTTHQRMPVVSKLRLSRSEDALARPIGTARMAHLHAGCRQVDPSCTLAPELDERAHARGASLDANARGGASAYQACKLSDDAWVATREVGSLCASANLFDGATATHDAPAQEARPKALCSNMPAAPATTASAVATVASAWGAQPPGFAVRHGMGHSTACGVVALSSPTARARAADGGRSHGLKRPALSTLSNKMQPRSQPHFGCGLESDAGMDADLSFDSREPTRPPSACHLAEATAAAGHDLALASARRVSTSDNASHSSKLSTSSTQLDFAAIAVAEASALHLPPAPELHAAHGAPSIGKMKGRPLYEPQPTEALHTTLIDSRGLMPSAALHVRASPPHSACARSPKPAAPATSRPHSLLTQVLPAPPPPPPPPPPGPGPILSCPRCRRRPSSLPGGRAQRHGRATG